MHSPVTLVGVLALCACGGPAAFAASTFENDVDGWALSGNGDETAATLRGQGGNPNGHLCGKDTKDAQTWYFVAPQKFLGNATSIYGKRLTWDVKQGSTFNQIRGRDVVLNGGGLALAFNVRFAPGTEWTPYAALLSEGAAWVVEDGSLAGVPATEADLKTVLRNLTSLRIRGEFYDGPNDTACLDNIYFGTQ